MRLADLPANLKPAGKSDLFTDLRGRLPPYLIVTQCKSSTLFARCTTVTFLREAQGII